MRGIQQFGCQTKKSLKLINLKMQHVLPSKTFGLRPGMSSVYKILDDRYESQLNMPADQSQSI